MAPCANCSRSVAGVLVEEGEEAPSPGEEVDPVEHERRALEALFARASEEQVAAVGAMVRPLSQWLAPVQRRVTNS